MSLLDDIRAEVATKSRCPVYNLKLSSEERADLEAAMADPTLPGPAIARALAKHGHVIAVSGLLGHRRGDCKCRS